MSEPHTDDRWEMITLSDLIMGVCVCVSPEYSLVPGGCVCVSPKYSLVPGGCVCVSVPRVQSSPRLVKDLTAKAGS